MNNQINPETLIKKTQRYEFEDGLRDIQFGIFFLLLGLTYWIGYHPAWWRLLFSVRESGGRFSMMASAVLLFALPVVIMIFMHPLIKRARQHWLWRDSGMVTPLRQIVPTWITIVSAVLFLVSFVIGFLLSPTLGKHTFFAWNWLWATEGWVLGFLLIALGRHLNLRRYIGLGIVGGLASTVVLFLRDSLNMPVLVFGLIWGLLLIVTGGVVLNQRRAELQEVEHVG